MIGRLPAVVDTGRRLQQVESLLDQVTEDLCLGKVASPGARCTSLLNEAAAELQMLSALVTESCHIKSLPVAEAALLRRQLSSLLSRTWRLNRLLLAAADFYRGWCAAGVSAAEPSPTYPMSYESTQWSRGPALLAYEG